METQVYISDQLKKARMYEASAQTDKKMSQKQIFHLCAPVGWINDPNGFSVFQGETHLFFQYYPYDVVWGPMHWGHAKTKDFIKWESMPAALAPDKRYDSFGCFSGSAMEYQGKHVLAYTGTEEVEIDGQKDVLQTQCIAVGDGTEYQKWEQNPVLCAKDLPEGGSSVDFRDPKIWKAEDGIYMAVANRAQDGCGQILLYRTQDMRSWEFITILAASGGRYGKMWECPDFFQLDGSYVLMVSPQEMEAEEGRFHAGDNSIFLAGDYRKQTHEFIEREVYAVDYGLDFYAPQTMLALDGRRIMIAWMQSWSVGWFDSEDGFCGMMTIPRELYLKGGKICQLPVRELTNYYTNRKVELMKIKPGSEFVSYEQLKGRCQDMEWTLYGENAYRFTLHIAADDSHYTSISYDKAKQELIFDRSCSGVRRDAAHRRLVKVLSNGSVFKMRLLMDRYSVELFLNDGEQALTSVIRTPDDADGVLFKADGEVLADVVKHEINVR